MALTPDGLAVEPRAFSPRLREALGEEAPLTEAPEAEPTTLKAAVEQAERRAVLRALEEGSGNVAAAARILGVTRPGLYKVMERLGIERG